MSDDEAADRLPSSLKPQLRLTRTDRLRLLLLVLLGAASLWLGFSLYDRVFPEATIRFDVGRKESRQQAERWLAERGWPLAGYRYASAFSYADTAKTFLEKELGLEEMDRIVAERARIWKWSHRWFRPLQEEEFLVEITPGGELAGFDHVLGEKVPGAKLDVPQARAIAEAELRHLRPEGLDGLRFLGATTRNLDMRADHSFTWELAGVDWKGGRYRYEVTIRGDHLGGYRQYVKVPEEWVRSYAGLRSKNEAAGAVDSVFFVLTALAMVVVLFLNARRGLVRWRFALTFGIVGASLLFLSSLNSLPQALYGYDTTKSFGGFLSETILMSLLGAIGLGVLLTVLVGAGESEYREHFPRKLSLARLFRWQGLRTKEFLFSAVGGFALTCFFLAYQTVFYLAASKLGAWSPAEVPYDELLNSAFPWAFLLFIGFLPAVSEEFMSRAFSIPFFHRLFKSRWLAVVLAAFIWGFGHSTYPNQPFYIRGLEVGLAGVLIGVLMIRFNVLALLVWHYTVDAMYSGYLLLRSGNPYYVTTTILAGCVMLLPLAVAIVAYLRTGRFADPEPMRHENDATAPKPIEEAEASVEAAAASAAAGGSEPVASEDTGARAGVIAPAPPLSARTAWIFGAGIVAAFAISWAATRSIEAPEPEVRIGRAEAMRRASDFLSGQAIRYEDGRTVWQFNEEVNPDAERYVLSHAGLDEVGRLWPGLLPAQSWSVRRFRPLSAEEVRVRVDAAKGRVVAFEHRVAERDSLPTVSSARAESIAVSVLDAAGIDVAGMEKTESSEKPRPKRTDHEFTWESTLGDPRTTGEARYRVDATVNGDQPGSFGLSLKIPESYERERGRHNALWGLALALVLVGTLGLLALTFRDASRTSLRGIGWKQFLRFGIFGAALGLLSAVAGVPRVLYRYDTTVAWGNYLLVVVVGFLTATILYFFVAWAGAALARALQPSITAVLDRGARRSMLPAALLALVLAPLAAKVIGNAGLWLAAAFPRSAAPPGLDVSAHLGSALPALSAIVSTIGGTFLAGIVAAALVRVVPSREAPGRALRIAILASLLLGIVLLPARSGAEALQNAIRLALPVVAIVLFARILLRGNPLAYLAAIYGFFVLRSPLALAAEPDGWARANGIAAIVVLLIPVVWLWLDSRRGAVAGARD